MIHVPPLQANESHRSCFWSHPRQFRISVNKRSDGLPVARNSFALRLKKLFSVVEYTRSESLGRVRHRAGEESIQPLHPIGETSSRQNPARPQRTKTVRLRQTPRRHEPGRKIYRRMGFVLWAVQPLEINLVDKYPHIVSVGQRRESLQVAPLSQHAARVVKIGDNHEA